VATVPESPSGALASVVEQGRRVLAEWGVAATHLAGVGVAVPGLVEPESGVCLLAPNLGWERIDIVAGLAGLTSSPVTVINVAQAVLAAEHREGCCRDATDAVLLYEDSGIGAALLVDGRLVRGARGIAGELGHCKLPGADGPCGCGGRGCLETVASVPAMLRRAASDLGVSVSGHQGMRQLAALPQAADLIRDAGRQLGHGASWVVNVLDPDVLVIAGGFLDAGEDFLRGLEEALAVEVLPDAMRHLAVRVSQLRDDAPIRGAVLLALLGADAAGEAAVETRPA
jgi:predicted NBD/HSP70 family sugar kinase